MTQAVVLRSLVAVAGLLVAVLTLLSAVRSVVIPRAVSARIARTVFTVTRALFNARLGRVHSYDDRDRVMASYAPLSLLALLLTWLLAVFAGYVGVFWGLRGSLPAAVRLSGSSLLTLGFERPPTLLGELASFTEAGIGLVLLALLITFLPSLYGTFSRREAAVSKLEVRAGSPPTGVELLERAWLVERFDLLPNVWTSWEDWFIDLAETHTSLPALPFFRSPTSDHSWVTAAGAVLDGASLHVSIVDGAPDVDAQLTIRAGYLALRRLCVYFHVPFDPDPAPDDPVSIRRDEFDAAWDRLAAAGLPLRADKDQGWLDFCGWRVNYDVPLLSLATLTMAPYAPWSSDRSMTDIRMPRSATRRSPAPPRA